MEQYAIVGNGPAGLSAAEAIRRVDRRSEIVMLAEEPWPSYSRVLLSHYLEGEVNERELYWRGPGIAGELGVEERLGIGVVAVDPDARRLTLASGEVLPYTRLLLATGARPQTIEAAGSGLRGIHTLRTMAEARVIREEAGRVGRALVVGGGLVALKAALALSHLGLAVTLAVSSPRLLSRNLDRDGSTLVQRHLEEYGLRFLLHESVRAFAGDGTGRVQAAALAGGRELPCGLVVAGKGVRPHVELARAAGLAVRSGIVVGPHLETSRAGIYAAGDAAEGLDPVLGDYRVNAIWPSAVAQGKAAGLNMAGLVRGAPGLPGMNAVVLAGLPVISAGAVQGDGPGEEVRVRFSPRDRRYRKVVLREDRIVGVCLVGEVSSAGMLIGLMRAGARVARPERLLDDGLAYPLLKETVEP